MSKTRGGEKTAPLFSAGGRRRRLSSGRPLWCQSVLSDFFGRPGFPGIWPQKSLGAAEGLPSCVRSDSTEARENTHRREKIKCLSAARFSSRLQRPAPSGRRLSSGRLRGRQPVLSDFFRRPPEVPETDENRQQRSLWGLRPGEAFAVRLRLGDISDPI